MYKTWLLVEAEDGYISPVRFFDTEEMAREAMTDRFRTISGWTAYEGTEYLTDDTCADLDWENGVMTWWDDGTGKQFGWRVQEVGNNDKLW